MASFSMKGEMGRGLQLDPLLVFMHIPKTAGVSLLKVILKQYSLHEIGFCYFQDLETIHEELKLISNNPNIKYCCGHFLFSVHEQITRPYTFFTMLREPVERVLSFYYFCRSNPYHPFHKKTLEMSFEEFITTTEVIPHIVNFQTRSLTDDFPVTQDSVEKAKENIHQFFSLVGITEMFNETLFLMKKRFGWENVFYTKENITKRPSEPIKKDTIDLIIELNKYDIELYEWAKAQLQQTISNLPLLYKVQLYNFKNNQNVLNQQSK